MSSLISQSPAQTCKKELKREAFEAAIGGEREAPVSKSIVVEDLVVPPSYKGPSFEGDITLEFVLGMIEEFKVSMMIICRLKLFLPTRVLCRSNALSTGNMSSRFCLL
jgi:hypothetical protein